MSFHTKTKMSLTKFKFKKGGAVKHRAFDKEYQRNLSHKTYVPHYKFEKCVHRFKDISLPDKTD